MANSYQNTLTVLNKIHAHFAMAVNFIPTVHSDYDARFARPGEKIGDTMLIKRQNVFTHSTAQAIAPSAITEQSDALVLNFWDQVSVLNADKDLVLSIDDKDDQLLVDMSNNMAEYLEQRHIANAMLGVHFYTGTAGVAPANLTPFANARTILNQAGVPTDKRELLITSGISAGVVIGQQTIFNPAAEISGEYVKGKLGPVTGYPSPLENDLIGTITTGSRSVGNTYTVASHTTSTIVLSGGTNGQTVKAGETLTIAGCYIYRSGVAMLTAFQCVITGDAVFNVSGGVTLYVSPTIVTSGAGQNITATPDGQTVTFAGAASTAYKWSLAYHRKFYTFGSVKLTDPDGAMMHGQKAYKNVNFRVWMDRDVTNSQFPLRLDCLSGGIVHPVPSFVPAVRLACAG
jgi:hypothetical protein